MDVVFRMPDGRSLPPIEIWYFSTVLEMKEKILEYHRIPVENQRLFFKGKHMEDDKDTVFYEVVHGSQIEIIVEPERHQKTEGQLAATTTTTPTSKKINLVVKSVTTKRQFALEVDAAETVARLKERVQEAENVPGSQLVLSIGNVELQEQRSLSDYNVSDQTEVVASAPLVPQHAPSVPGSPAAATAPKMMKVMVLPMGGNKKIAAEVNPKNNVSELRKELQRLQGQLQFTLPSQDYFFIYKQDVMDEDRTFQWHDVKQGDTIEMFNGSVTGGS